MHMKRASRGRQPVSRSLSGGRAPNRHKANCNSSQSRQHFAAESAQFKAIFKEALFEDSKDVSNFFNRMTFSFPGLITARFGKARIIAIKATRYSTAYLQLLKEKVGKEI